jgi:hypothetical protein
MSFAKTNRLRSKQSDLANKIKEFPAMLSAIQEQIIQVFDSFDSIGQEIVSLAMFDVDPALLDTIDNNFKKYKSNKAGLLKSLEDLTRISNLLKENSSTIMNKDTKSNTISDSVIDDLQSILTHIDSTLGGDVEKQLNQLKELEKGLQTLNKPVEHINESLAIFQKTVNSSFEIFTKSILESMKNSVEMNAILETMEIQMNDWFKSIEAKVIEIESSTRGIINESMANIEHKINKSIEQHIKEFQISISSDIENIISEKVIGLEKKLLLFQNQLLDEKKTPTQPLSKDRQELNKFKEYLFSWPTDKDELTKKIEEFRDILLVHRGVEAPYRVTAMNLFRESLTLLTREDRIINQSIVRSIIDIIEKLEEIIKKSET